MLAQQRITAARAFVNRAPRTSRLTCKASARPSLQLATAKLPNGVQVDAFSSYLYNWAATLTQSGANYPFALPLATDKLPTGFKISLLKAKSKGDFASAADIEATVENVDGQGSVLFVRFFEGPAAGADWRSGEPSRDPQQRLEVLAESLVDVPTIMQTMPRAIRKAVQMAS